MDKTREETAKSKESSHGILQSMTRQYKGMEEDLLQKIVAREGVIQEQVSSQRGKTTTNDYTQINTNGKKKRRGMRLQC